MCYGKVSSLLWFGQVRGSNYQFNAVLSIRTTHFRNQFNNVTNGRTCPKLPSLTRSLLSVLFARTSPSFTSLFGSSPINSLDSHYQLPISYFPSRFPIIRSLSFLAFWLMRLVAWVANRIWLTCPPWRPGSNAHFLASHAHSGMTYMSPRIQSNLPQNSPLNRFP